jgi:hypothetical protein
MKPLKTPRALFGEVVGGVVGACLGAAADGIAGPIVGGFAGGCLGWVVTGWIDGEGTPAENCWSGGLVGAATAGAGALGKAVNKWLKGL